MPRDKVIFKGNWDVTGLAGTGSYDYEVPEQHFRRDFTLERTANMPLRGGPAFALGLAAFACAGHAAVALGLMKRALMEVVGTAVAKTRPGYPSVIGDHPIFRQQFSVQEACYQACRQYVLQVFGDAEDAACAGRPITMEQRARFRQATTWAHQIAADVVRFCHYWSGTAAIRASSPMGRCMRDIYAATQHVFVDPVTLADAAPAIMEPWAALLRETQPQPSARASV
jgi:alkylation response protein AidB-like acyl-CoA dehydrogenase